MSIRSNFAWVLFGNITYAASQWGLMQLLTVWGDAAAIGQLALGLAIATPIVLFGEKAVRIIVATDIDRNETLAEYLGFFLITSFLILLCTFLPLSLSRSPESQLVILLVLSNKLIEGASEVINGYFQQLEQMQTVGQSKIVKSVITLAVFAVALAGTSSLIVGLIATAICRLFVISVYDRWTLHHVSRATARPPASMFPAISFKTTIRLLKFALPLCIASFMISTSASVPRLYLAEFCGDRELGIFSVIFYLTVPATTVLGALFDISRPRFNKFYQQHQFNSLYWLAGLQGAAAGSIGILSVLGAWLWGETVLQFLYGSEYSQHAEWLVLIAISTLAGFLATVPATILTAIRKFNLVLINCSTTLTVSIVAAPWLIHAFSTKGAIYSMTLTHLVHGTVSTVMLVMVFRGTGSRRLVILHPAPVLTVDQFPPRRLQDAA